MKYTFETSEKEEAEILLNAFDVKSSLWDFSCWLRDAIKYENLAMDLKTLEAVRKELIEQFKELPDYYIR